MNSAHVSHQQSQKCQVKLEPELLNEKQHCNTCEGMQDFVTTEELFEKERNTTAMSVKLAFSVLVFGTNVHDAEAAYRNYRETTEVVARVGDLGRGDF